MGEKDYSKHIISVIVISLAILLIVPFLNFPMTGHAIYENQPDSTSGKDSYIRSDFANTNFGTDIVLEVGKTASNYELRSFLFFNLSSITSTDTITESILQLYLSSSSDNENLTIKAYRLIKNWDESEVTWNSNSTGFSWDSAGGDYSGEIGSVNVTNETDYYNMTITNTVRGWINGTYNNYGLILVAQSPTTGTYKDFDSSDSSTASYRPKIYVTHFSNFAPVISDISVNSSLANPTQIGETIKFNITWSDNEDDDARIFICNSSNINLTGCQDTEFCNTSYSSTANVNCSYTILPSDNRTTSFWVSACDAKNCSQANQSYFYVNHNPNITIISPNGGETINQSADGNYSIQFNVSDIDSDSLTANLYYGETQNSTTNSIVSNLDLTNYCTDLDSDTSTKNNCSYLWNTSELYGDYYVTIVLNDSYVTVNDSSDASCNIVSLIDPFAPNISAQWIDSYEIYSGKTVTFYANVSDTSLEVVWVSINTTPQTNLTMTNYTGNTYYINWTAPEIGTYTFKTYANDSLSNINNSLSEEIFNVTTPNATTQNNFYPSNSLPYHVIKISGQLNATDSITNVSAYLNVPANFTFLNNYPQNNIIGDIPAGTTKTATWYLSTPLTEGTYLLNITYTDQYNNQWNSSNIEIQVTSSIGSYYLALTGYPEVVGGDDYYTEATFEKAGVYTDPDSITVSLYDSTGNLVVEGISMTKEETGKYNYTYFVSSSATEGQWETRVNATKSGTSYYANEFWKVVGGPFDIRNIQLNDVATPDLDISVTTENTGDVNKDLILIWNLSREDTGEILDSGSETFMVEANSEKDWRVYPTTSYVGQVRITFLGYYSGTEKAGAYRIFSTTPEETTSSSSGGGGGGGGGGATPRETIKQPEISFSEFEKIIYLTKNIKKKVLLKIKNTGQTTLNNLSLKLEGVDNSLYSISPKLLDSLKINESATFEIDFFVENYSGDIDFFYVINSTEISKKQLAKISVLPIQNYFMEEIKRLNNLINELYKNANDRLKKDIPACEDLISKGEYDVENQDFIKADETLKQAEECINKIKDKIGKRSIIGIPSIEGGYFVWIITWLLIIILLLILGWIAYLMYKKFGAINFFQAKESKPEDQKIAKDNNFYERLKNIKQKIED